MQTNPSTSFKMFEETYVPEDELIISRTDLKGIITYANETFAEISGYSIEELVGQSHNILRHPDMPKSAFTEMWSTIQKGQMWKGYVKNLRKDGGYYWVYAEVSVVIKNDRPIEYKSMRSHVLREKRYEMQEKYDRQREQEDGLYRASVYLTEPQLKKLTDLST